MQDKIQVGIHSTGYCSSASVFLNETPVFAAQEERLSRIKFDNSFPMKSIYKGLKAIGADIDDVQEFLFSWNPVINAASRYRAGFSKWVPNPMQRLYSGLNHILPALAEDCGNVDTSEQIVRYFGKKEIKFNYVNHHFAHIGMSVYTSPFEDTAVMIADGYGELKTTVFAHKTADGNIKILKTADFPHSLGMFYAAFTEFLGFEPEKDEWKLMGAAAYGDPDTYADKVRSMIQTDMNGNFSLVLEYFNFYNFETQNTYTAKFSELLGEPFSGTELTQREYDLAAAVQLVFEETVFGLLNWLHKQTGTRNLCLGGGAFMNCLANGKIAEYTPFSEVFVPFAPDDSGNAIGSVLYMNKKQLPYMSPYTGNSHTENEIEDTLKKFKLTYRISDENGINDFTVSCLMENRIVSWFSGRMEFGQRALGNRSIFASPLKAETKDIINSAVKYRESFRPFAPAIMHEKGGEWFENYVYTPYMERILKFKSQKTDYVPAVVHNDGTGRLQSVRKQDNERFYNLISAFERRTGVPVILNTSLNKAGEPIVATAEDAIKTFFTSGIDVMILDKFILEK